MWYEVEKRHGDIRPLNDQQRGVIDANRPHLINLIDPKHGLTDRLHENRCFSDAHKDYIEYGVSTMDKADRLLDIVRRRSVANFNKLVDELYRGNQPLLAQLLAEGKGKITSSALYCYYLFK